MTNKHEKMIKLTREMRTVIKMKQAEKKKLSLTLPSVDEDTQQ